MRFINPIPFVRDIDRARAFYRDVMQLQIRADHGIELSEPQPMRSGTGVAGNVPPSRLAIRAHALTPGYTILWLLSP
jgi:catechol 2,3-dioxygenase-like lactoylglutathione lyase family enzyme